MKLSTFFLVLWTIPLSLSAQIQRITSFPADGDFAYQQFEDKFLFISGSVWIIDPAEGRADSLTQGPWGLDELRFNSRGAFCVSFAYDSTGNSGFHQLHHIDTAGTVFTSAVINQRIYPFRNPPQHPSLSQDRYYISGQVEGIHQVWESDGTEAGTRVIFESEAAILDMATLNDQLLILAQSDIGYEFYRYTYQDSLTLFASFSKDEYVSPSLRIIGEDETFLYFNMNDSSGLEAIWRTNLSSMGTSLFLEAFNAEKIQMLGERFYLQTGTTRDLSYFIGFRDVPELIDTLRFAPGYDTPSQRLIHEIGPGVFRCASYEFGIELGYLNDENQIQLYQDLATGASSSVPCRFYSTRSGCYSDDNYFIDNGTVYTVLSNGNDPYYYLYEVSEEGSQSLLRTEDPFKFRHPTLYDGKLYWFEYSASYNIMKSYQVDQVPQDIQPESPQDPDVWIRQMMTAFTDLPFQRYYQSASALRLFPRGVEMGADGSVYAGFLDNGWAGYGKEVAFSDTTVRSRMKGNNVFVKYDPHGNLLWHISLGSLWSSSVYFSTFATDYDGNLIVAGTYSKRAFFGEDSLTTNRTGRYLLKIDGNSGDLLWKKQLTQVPYFTSLELGEDIVFDEDNNLFLTFLYRDSRIAFDGVILSSDRTSTHALASYDSDGNLRWVNNMTPPWTDFDGETQIFEMNESDQTLMVGQSQDYRDPGSSCGLGEWRYILQTFDREGALLDTFQFEGNNFGRLVDGAFTENGRFIGLGYHREKLDFGRFSTLSPQADDCHEIVGFFFEYAPDLSDIVYAGAFNEVDFIPLAMRSYQGHTYKLGTRQGRLMILKYTDQGAFIGAKALNQRASVFSTEFHAYFDVKDGYIVVQGGNFTYDVDAQISPLLIHEQTIALLRIEDSGWNIEEEGFDVVEAKPELEEDELSVYPNPFYRSIRVLLSEKAASSTQYEVFTIQGQRLLQGTLTGDKIQEIVLPELAAGTYLLKLSGGDEVFSEKVVKY